MNGQRERSGIVAMPPFFLRVRDVAAALGASERQVLKWTSAGKLKTIRLPDDHDGEIRAVRYAYDDVAAFAAKIRGESQA